MKNRGIEWLIKRMENPERIAAVEYLQIGTRAAAVRDSNALWRRPLCLVYAT